MADDSYEIATAMVLTDSATPADFGTLGLDTATVTNTTDTGECSIGSTTATTLECAALLADPGDADRLPAWHPADIYEVDAATVLHDSTADFVTAGVSTDDYLVQTRAGAVVGSCAVGTVAATTLTCSGDELTWDTGDEYSVLSSRFELDASVEAAVDGTVTVSGTQCAGANHACAAFTLVPFDPDNLPATFDELLASAPAWSVEYGKDLITGTVTTSGFDDVKDLVLAAGTIDWALLGDGFDIWASMLDTGLDGRLAAEYLTLPLVGFDLDAGAELDTFVSDYLPTPPDFSTSTDVMADLETWVASLSDPLPTAAVTVECFSPGPDGECLAENTFNAKITLDWTAQSTDTTPAFEVGLPSLTVFSDENLAGTVPWDMSVTFGLSRLDGGYLEAASLTVDDAAVTFADTSSCGDTAWAPSNWPTNGWAFSDRCITGVTGFLPAELWDADGAEATSLSYDIALDHTTLVTAVDYRAGNQAGPSAVITDSDAQVNLILRTLAYEDGQSFPSILGTMSYTWNATDDFSEVAFGDLALDPGQWYSDTLGPIVGEVHKFTKPFQPIVDTLNAPIPVVSDLAVAVGEDPVTPLSLLEAAVKVQARLSGDDRPAACKDSDPDNDPRDCRTKAERALDLVKKIVAVVSFINGIPADGEVIPLGTDDGAPGPDYGRFEIEPAEWKAPPCSTSDNDDGRPADDECEPAETDPAKQKDRLKDTDAEKSLLSKSDIDVDTSFDAGISFPFLDDATEIYGVLLGFDTTLFRFEAEMSASAGLSKSFFFVVGPVPLELTIGGSITLAGRVALGYDTYGMRSFLAGEDPPPNGYVLSGIFFDDLDADGVDVPEASLTVAFTASAAVSILIFKAGLEGGVSFTLGLDLNDPNGDGKVRIEEIGLFANNPICLFAVTGTIGWFLAAFLEIDLFFWSKRITFTLFRGSVEVFRLECDPPVPVLATVAGGDLGLNVGPDAAARNVYPGETAEQIRVRQLSETTAHGTRVSVTAFGIYQEYTVPVGGRISVDGGSDDDAIVLQPGGVPLEVIDGKVNINGDGTVLAPDGTFAPIIDGLDDGVLETGEAIIDGMVDLNGDGVIDANDTSASDAEWVDGFPIINGRFDYDGNGVVNAADDGLL
ncbi:MAG: hypothetical protein KJO84_04285, partial [Acidimicrobiia bacterium]|nr:hypothetical protein [Acidimicrobiia bacterium]